MTLQLSSELVWRELDKGLFAVLGMVTAKGEARTVGVVYVVRDGKLYIGTERDTWKARHIGKNPHVSVTVAIPKHIPFLPWVKIPPATITFSGVAAVLYPEHVESEVLSSLLRGLEITSDIRSTLCLIEVKPAGDFITYGVGVSLMTMRHPEKAYGRASVALQRP